MALLDPKISRSQAQRLIEGGYVLYNGTRIKKRESIAVAPFVFDLQVEGDESYMTTAGLAHNGGKRKAPSHA